MITFDRIKTMQAGVGMLLKEILETRNDDSALTLAYVDRYGGDALALNGAISRCRRKFTEMGLYWPTSESVAKARRLDMEIWRKWAKSEGL